LSLLPVDHDGPPCRHRHPLYFITLIWVSGRIQVFQL
jgi:hypothetical protein